jgi:long-chain acyl-CoA synthetase
LCEQHPDATAIEFEARWTSWGDVSLRAATLHSTLVAAGLGPTDAVGVVVRERPPAVSALLAFLAEGRPVVLIQSLAADDELSADIGRLPVRAVVAEHDDWERVGVRECVHSAGMVGVSLGEQPTDVALIDGAPVPPTERPALDAGVAALVPTSGTTGAPSRHAVTTVTLDDARTRVTVRDPDQTQGVTISAVPLSSIGGFMGLVSTVWRGRPIALMERFDLDRWVALVRKHRPRRIGVPPPIISEVLDRELPREWFDSVRWLGTGSAPLDAGIARRFADRYGIAVLNAYGATEFGGPVVAWREDDWEPWNATKLGSVGRPLPGVELRLAAAEPATDGEAGILEVRPPGGAWTRTNDLARIDSDGFVWILQRVDDVIVRGGFKVRASDVEAALTSHESVREAVVVGIPDRRLGSVPAAMVTVHLEAAPVTDEELRTHVRSLLAPYKVPVVVRIVHEIPRNAMMKPRRAQIRDALGGGA